MRSSSILGLAFLMASTSLAGTQNWQFDLTTTGSDVSWSSPTPVCTLADAYDTSYEIVLLDVTVVFGGSFVISILNEIPAEDRSGAETVNGPLPIQVASGSYVWPEPPLPAAISADLDVRVDATGFGRVDLTNVTLGSATVNIPPFGEQTVPVTAIRVVGNISVTDIVTGDVTGDGEVDLNDLAAVLANFGTVAGATLADGDTDGDGDVDLTDLATILARFGVEC